MNTSHAQSCETYSMEIPSHLGEGSITGVNFDEGMGLLMYDCLFYEDTEFQFVINEVHPLKFTFCEKGEFSHRFQDDRKNHNVEALENIIVASNRNKGHIIKFKANVHTKINNLEVDRKRFYESRPCEIGQLDMDLKELFEDVTGSEIFYHHGNYSLRTARIFEGINNFSGTPFLRDLFIHSQSYHIFFIQLLEYQDACSAEEDRSILLERELNLIREASRLIDSGFLNFQTIHELSKKVGLNPNKLQSGFKDVYGKTINEYVQERRLREATVLIKNTDLSFSEIAERVGIQSKSYFSKIFKDDYGITPSEIRKNQEKINRGSG